MKLFNKELTSSFAYRKYFPGASAAEIAEYVVSILKKDKLDAIVIQAGCNSLPNKEVGAIADDIFEIVNLCHEHGVNDIFVSGITHRYFYANKVRELNEYLNQHSAAFEFNFINNDDILPADIINDGIHLNLMGLYKIARNIIKSINALSNYER